MKKYVLDGRKIDGLESFFVAFGEMVNGPGGYFGRNLTAFNDCLYGGYGLSNPCEIEWIFSEISRKFLDRVCRAGYLSGEIDKWDDEEIVTSMKESLRTAMRPESPSMMDVLVETIMAANVGSVAIKLVLA